jgi:adenylate cyclase
MVRPQFIEETLEAFTLDMRFFLRNIISRPVIPDNILIVAIDEKSLREYGRWPWSRFLMSELVEKILFSEPRVLFVDIFFSESENKAADEALGNIFRRSKDKVVIATAFDVWIKKKYISRKEIPEQVLDSAILRVEGLKEIKPIEADDVLASVPEISKDVITGHIYNHPDYDGKLRWEILYLKYGDEILPSLSLQASRIAIGLEMDKIEIFGNKGVRLGEKVFIPTDKRGRMLVNYIGREGSFRYISASDVLKGYVNKSLFKDKIVLLGTTAIATYDLKNTPFSANMPGVEKNATVIENIVNKRILRKSHGYVEIIFLILTSLIMIFALPRLNALKGAGVCLVLFLSYVSTVLFLFIYKGVWVNFVYPATNIIVVTIFVIVVKYFFEEKKAREIRGIFSSYVSPKIVEELINDPMKARLGGERKVVTVLFSDIIGFTSLSEERSPEEVVELLNEYFSEMTNIIFKWDGTLDKFVGDEIMAFWGAPLDQPNHAELAVRCAMNMIGSLKKMQERWLKENKVVLDCGIGINTGEVVVGNIGAEGKKMDYTLIGDNVNIAARVEKLTRTYNAKILITENTLNYLRDVLKDGRFGHCEFKSKHAVKVKGKEKPIELYEVVPMSH